MMLSTPTRIIVICACLIAATVLAGVPGTEVFLPSVGRGPGVGTSRWYTAVWIHNPGTATARCTIRLLIRDQTNTAPEYATLVVEPGQTLKLGDVLGDVFGRDQVVGALGFTSDQPIVVASRIFNLPGSDIAESQGQFFAGVPTELALSLGEATDVPGITQPADGSFRCNFGLVETAGSSVAVRVALHDGQGTEMATKIFDLEPYEPMQENLSALAAGVAIDGGRLHFEVVSGHGSILAFASMVGNGVMSQDPSTLEMEYKAASRSVYHRSIALNQASIDVTNAWAKIFDYLTFDKKYQDTAIEVHLNSRANVDAFSSSGGVVYQIRLDDEPAAIETQGSVRNGTASEFLSMMAVFEDVPAGEHTISVWARSPSGSATGVGLDYGGWGGGIIAHETW